MNYTPPYVFLIDRGPLIKAFFILMAVLPTIAVILRFWSRALLPENAREKPNSRFWWDDWVVLIATAINIAVSGLGLNVVDRGLGNDFNTASSEDLISFIKRLLALYVLFDTGIFTARALALLFFARVFNNSPSRFRYALSLVQVLNAACYLSNILMICFSCSPFKKYWMPDVPGYCMSWEPLFLAGDIPILTIDILILLLPLPMLYKLHMPWQRKLLVTGAFVSGYCVPVVSIGRIATSVASAKNLEGNPAYELTSSFIWAGLETPICIISICLPSIFFLARRGFQEGPKSLIKL